MKRFLPVLAAFCMYLSGALSLWADNPEINTTDKAFKSYGYDSHSPSSAVKSLDGFTLTFTHPTIGVTNYNCWTYLLPINVTKDGQKVTQITSAPTFSGNTAGKKNIEFKFDDTLTEAGSYSLTLPYQLINSSYSSGGAPSTYTGAWSAEMTFTFTVDPNAEGEGGEGPVDPPVDPTLNITFLSSTPENNASVESVTSISTHWVKPADVVFVARYASPSEGGPAWPTLIKDGLPYCSMTVENVAGSYEMIPLFTPDKQLENGTYSFTIPAKAMYCGTSYAAAQAFNNDPVTLTFTVNGLTPEDALYDMQCVSTTPEAGKSYTQFSVFTMKWQAPDGGRGYFYDPSTTNGAGAPELPKIFDATGKEVRTVTRVQQTQVASQPIITLSFDQISIENSGQYHIVIPAGAVGNTPARSAATHLNPEFTFRFTISDDVEDDLHKAVQCQITRSEPSTNDRWEKFPEELKLFFSWEKTIQPFFDGAYVDGTHPVQFEIKDDKGNVVGHANIKKDNFVETEKSDDWSSCSFLIVPDGQLDLGVGHYSMEFPARMLHCEKYNDDDEQVSYTSAAMTFDFYICGEFSFNTPKNEVFMNHQHSDDYDAATEVHPMTVYRNVLGTSSLLPQNVQGNDDIHTHTTVTLTPLFDAKWADNKHGLNVQSHTKYHHYYWMGTPSGQMDADGNLELTANLAGKYSVKVECKGARYFKDTETEFDVELTPTFAKLYIPYTTIDESAGGADTDNSGNLQFVLPEGNDDVLRNCSIFIFHDGDIWYKVTYNQASVPEPLVNYAPKRYTAQNAPEGYEDHTLLGSAGVDLRNAKSLSLVTNVNGATAPYTVNFADNVVTGIENVASAYEGEEWFTADGIPVEKPVKGLYIRVLNGKATKVMVK